MKLIDILNKIANGELKEGTKVKSKEKNEVFTLRTRDEYGTELDLFDEDNYSLLRDYWLIKKLNEECELIEPDHFADVGKMAEPTDNNKIEELDMNEFVQGNAIDYRIVFKLNEVIRYINKGG